MIKHAAAVFLILWSISQGAWADMIREIDHLLDFVGGSRCTYVRNGDQYDAAGARSHIVRVESCGVDEQDTPVSNRGERTQSQRALCSRPGRRRDVSVY